tara:strand:+ start:1789 stop:2391 length:603 start_codon:yes stop_codon:yes gene_type:complete
MKSKLFIYSDTKIEGFLRSLLSEFELVFMKFNDFDYKLYSSQPNIFILSDNKEVSLIDLKKLKNNCLIITNKNINNINLNNKLRVLRTPLTTNHIKSKIENFVQNISIKFHDICIDNEKLTNLNNQSFCYLTKVELEILSYLVREKETSKNFIKENILNIKTNIETNSLESHLTRIRKKMNKVKTTVKIQTKSEKLLIVA